MISSCNDFKYIYCSPDIGIIKAIEPSVVAITLPTSFFCSIPIDGISIGETVETGAGRWKSPIFFNNSIAYKFNSFSDTSTIFN